MMKKSKRWAYPIVLFVLTLFLSLSSFRRFRSLAQSRARTEEELSILLDGGFYKEALSKLQSAESSDREAFALYEFKALLGMGNLARAQSFLDRSADLKKNKDVYPLFLDACLEHKSYDRAFLFLNNYREVLSHDLEDKYLIPLISEKRIFPSQAAYIGGWFNGVAIVKDELGAYLVNSQGQGLNYDRYDEIRPIQDGFMGMRKKHWALLDVRGRFKGLAQEGKEGLAESEDFFFERRKVKGLHGFFYKGREVLACDYEKLSPLSDRGLAYGLKEGKWYKITFTALESGLTQP